VNWAYTSAELMPDQAAFAGVAEVADRTYKTNWLPNLPTNLVNYPRP